MKLQFVKRENAADLVMILMIWALVSLLLTRFFLSLMGWPTISFGVWHIAHVLWGGLFMLAGIIMLLGGYGEKTRKIAAAVAGIGWGLFIDEIGKYLTKNNNYWFQPAIIFIYISFIILFLIYRFLEKTKPKDSRTLFYSAINQLEEVIEKGNLEKKDKKELLKKLKNLLKNEENSEKKKLIKTLLVFTKKTEVRPNDPNSVFNRIVDAIGHISYTKIFRNKLVLYGLGIYSAYYAIDKISEAFRIISNSQKMELIQKFYKDYEFFSRSDIYMIWLKIVTDVVVAFFFLTGLSLIAKKKILKGLTFFQYGLLINIFLSTVFRFYFEQFEAIFSLLISLIVLMGIRRLGNEIKNGFVV